MEKKRKQTAEFRYYSMPAGQCILALVGEKWVQCYGRDIDYLHFHNYLEIGYCYGGKGTMVLGEEEHRFSGGEVTVIPTNYLHTTNSDVNTVSRWEYVFVDVPALLKKFLKENTVRYEQMLRRINSKALYLKEADMGRWIRRVLDVMTNAEEFYLEEAESLLMAFFSEVARRNVIPNEKGRENEARSVNNILFRALDYISSEYSEAIKVRDIASYCHISENHLRRIFSSYMNMSPLEYINQVRIQTACEYLKKTDESVAMIAMKCGFSTSSTFNRNFRQFMGVTPIEWRRRPENYEQQILKYEVHTEEGW